MGSVLIVDDYKTMLRIVRNLLTQIGITDIDECSSGSEALQKLRERRYDLVISDSNMEPMTGLQLLRQVRSDNSLRSIPFVMIIAENRSEVVIELKEAGVSQILVKPFNADYLRNKLESMGFR